MSQPQVRPAQRTNRVPSLGPHSIAILLAASVIFTTGVVRDRTQSHDDLRGVTAECVVLEYFLSNPDFLADFEGTQDELQRWLDAYGRDCE